MVVGKGMAGSEDRMAVWDGREGVAGCEDGLAFGDGREGWQEVRIGWQWGMRGDSRELG